MARGFARPFLPAGAAGGTTRATSGGSLERMTEARLIAAARRGERKALEQLLRDASEPAYRFSRSFSREPREAEGLAQDVMSTMLRGLDAFRGDSSLSTWTYTEARRACARSQKRRDRAQVADATSPDPLAPTPPTADPPRRPERRQLGAALERAIASLPDAQRELIVLRDVEGLPSADVARIVGIGERAVKTRLHRARLVLREQLAPYVPGGDAPARRPRCPDAALLLSRWMEDELAPAACERMEKHVSTCPACAGACDSLRAVLAASRAYGRQPLPAAVLTAVRVSVRGLLQAR